MFKVITNNKFLLVFVTPFILGACSVFTFQPFNFTMLNFFILPIFFIILCDINKRSKNIYRKKPYLRNLFFAGYLFGIGFFLTGNYWISNSLQFDESFQKLIPFTTFLIPLTLGIFFGIAALFCGPFLKLNFRSVLLFSAVFSIIDYLRSNILTGFPWNIWAYSWSWFLEILQILNPIGMFAFNLLVITL